MFCGSCGSPIPQGNRFCPRCGTAINAFQAGAGAAAPPPPPAPAAAGPRPAFAPPPPPPVAAAPRPPSAPPPPAYPPPPVFAPPPPQPQYAPPAYGQPPAYPAPAQPPLAAAAPAPGGSPMPPNLHWALVLILSMFTGIFGIIWSFIQAGYVKKIDPSSRARMFLVLGLLSTLAQIVVMLGVTAAAIASGSATVATVGSLLGFVLVFLTIIFMLAAIFGMRRSLLDYFNSAEPIGLKLSGIMTFFFSILYLQYHLSRIAEWKKTGTLA